MSNTHNPNEVKVRNQPQVFPHSADHSSKHTPEKSQQKNNRSHSGSDKARGEST